MKDRAGGAGSDESVEQHDADQYERRGDTEEGGVAQKVERHEGKRGDDEE